MKRKIMKTIAGMMAVTIAISGCGLQKKIDAIDAEVSEAPAAEESAEEPATEASEEASEAASEAEAEEETFAKIEEFVETAEPGEYDSSKMMEGEALTEDELQKIESYFNNIENYGFTLSSYESPEDINWNDVFNCEAAGIGDCEYSQEAFRYFLDDMGIEDLEYYEGLTAVSGKDVRAFVEEKCGIKDFDVTKITFFTYVESEDVLFNFSDPFIYEGDVTCLEGVRNDDKIQVVIHFNDDSRFDRRLTLLDTGDAKNPYRFISNRQLWEAEADMVGYAIDYDTDEKIVCSIAIHEDEGSAIIKPVKDNVVYGYAEVKIQDLKLKNLQGLSEIGFSDLDGDGYKDLIVIMNDGDSKYAALCRGMEQHSWVEEYRDSVYDVTNWLGENVSDLTAENVINYTKDHLEEYGKADPDLVLGGYVNEYFPYDILTNEEYDAVAFFDEETDAVPVEIRKLANYENGDVYCIRITYDKSVHERFYYGVSDRYNLGTFYVTKDKIYLLEDHNNIPTVEDFTKKGIVVFSAEDSQQNIDGEEVTIKHEGDDCIVSKYNTLIESGFYSSFTWRKGKGLVLYRSGYGAEGAPIEIKND